MKLTNDFRKYQICGADYQLNIIETPGLADTDIEDTEDLNIIAQSILNVKELNAICIVMRAKTS